MNRRIVTTVDESETNVPGITPELPLCAKCGKKDYCLASRIGNDLHVYLCYDHYQGLLTMVQQWLRR